MKSITILGIFVADLAFFGKIPLKGETVLGEKFVVGPGGKGSNQAVAAGKAGAKVNFISKIGNDDYGKMAKKIYAESNVGIKNLIVSEEHSTGVAAILLNKETGDNAISVITGAAGALTIDDINSAEDEIKNSSIGMNSKINHLTFVGDALIGDDVIIGAGSVTCNFDGVSTQQTQIGDKAFIGSGVFLVAPVKVGNGATIGSGSVITEDVPAKKLTLARSKQITIEDWEGPQKIDNDKK